MSTTLGTWRNPPLAYVVAELVISPHYSLATFIPKLQDALRSAYPRTIEATEITFDAKAAPSPTAVWQLLSADQTHGVQFGSRAISLHATSYINSQDFMARWRQVLDAVAAAQIEVFVERAGIRYIDLIVPREGQSTSEYLSPALQGVSPPFGGKIQHTIWATSVVFDGITVQARTAAPGPSGELFPPNFSALPLRKPSVLNAAEESLRADRQTGFVDTDCFCGVQSVFNPDQLSGIFFNLHTKVSETFKLLISNKAREEWL